MHNPIDQDALDIGELFERAQNLSHDRVFCLQEAGNRLLKKKESLGHGQWLAWLKLNNNVLGFRSRGARTLINGAQWMESNWQLATVLQEIVTNPNATPESLARAEAIKKVIAGQFQPSIRGTFGRRRNEWYTPPEYISLARNVLGDIDVDPASSQVAQEIVQARTYFDKERDGLRQDWHGRVWLNPPYSQPLIGKFIGKLLCEWNSGRVQACIALTHNYTDAMWFHDAVSAASAVCFTQGRVRFYEPGGSTASPTQGQAFFYYGREVDTFKHEFARVGFIVRPEAIDGWTRLNVRAHETQAN